MDVFDFLNMEHTCCLFTNCGMALFSDHDGEQPMYEQDQGDIEQLEIMLHTFDINAIRTLEELETYFHRWRPPLPQSQDGSLQEQFKPITSCRGAIPVLISGPLKGALERYDSDDSDDSEVILYVDPRQRTALTAATFAGPWVADRF
jgi:hypothetical protein